MLLKTNKRKQIFAKTHLCLAIVVLRFKIILLFLFVIQMITDKFLDLTLKQTNKQTLLNYLMPWNKLNCNSIRLNSVSSLISSEHKLTPTCQTWNSLSTKTNFPWYLRKSKLEWDYLYEFHCKCSTSKYIYFIIYKEAHFLAPVVSSTNKAV